jgi:hypothetical protein
MDKQTFETLGKLMSVMHYIYEDRTQPADDEVLADIARIRAWMQEVEKDITE